MSPSKLTGPGPRGGASRPHASASTATSAALCTASVRANASSVRSTRVEGGSMPYRSAKASRAARNIVVRAGPVGVQRRQGLGRCRDLAVGRRGPQGGPEVRGPPQHQYTYGDIGPVQQGVAEQPGERGEGPAVGVVDQEEQAGGAGRAEVLAAGGRQNTAGALGRGDHPPAGRGPVACRLLCQAGLALPSGCVEPAGGAGRP